MYGDWKGKWTYFIQINHLFFYILTINEKVFKMHSLVTACKGERACKRYNLETDKQISEKQECKTRSRERYSQVGKRLQWLQGLEQRKEDGNWLGVSTYYILVLFVTLRQVRVNINVSYF